MKKSSSPKPSDCARPRFQLAVVSERFCTGLVGGVPEEGASVVPKFWDTSFGAEVADSVFLASVLADSASTGFLWWW